MKIDAIKQRELLDAIETIRSFIEDLEPSKACISCFNWRNDQCNKYRAVPPQEVITNGCPAWEIFDSIPF